MRRSQRAALESLFSPLALGTPTLLAAPVYLLEEMRHGPNQRGNQPQEQEESGQRPPKRSIGRQPRLECRRDKRHAEGDQREQSESSGECVEVSGHGADSILPWAGQLRLISSGRVDHLKPHAFADRAGCFRNGLKIDRAVFRIEQAVKL